jgi:transaldolase
MKIFIDTADINEINKYAFMIDGVTTNPSLIAKEKEKSNFEALVRKIVKIVDGPISIEVVNLKALEMINEARNLSSFSPNIVVKIPMSEEGLKATKDLNKMGIKTNVTLIFSGNQALLAAKAGATYVSPFIGRLEDIGHGGMEIVKDILSIYKNYGFETEVITASIRHPIHVLEAAKLGSHVATIPPNVLNKMFKHNLTDAGLKAFLDDWKLVSR